MKLTDINEEPPRIEFPCDYPIKIMGFASENFQTEIIEIVERHADQASGRQISVRASGKGNYVSVTVIIEATGEGQLQRLFQDLKANKNVKLVL